MKITSKKNPMLGTLVSLLKKNIVILGILLFGVLLLVDIFALDVLAATVPEAQIFHEQLLSFLGEHALPMEITAIDPAGVIAARCYFRFDSAAPYVFSEMTSGGDNRYATTLPAPAPAVQKVEYVFLVVNSRNQAIISPVFTSHRKVVGQRSVSGEQALDSQLYSLKSEVERTETVKNFFLYPTHVQITSAAQQQHFGVLAGLYTKEQLGTPVVSGYFGAFSLDVDNRIVARKGNIVPRHSAKSSVALDKGATSREIVEDTTPDIAGDGWTGTFWRSDAYAQTAVPVTAVVTQDTNGLVSITTSLEGLGNYFEGTIYSTGHLLLYDSYDDEDWSTHDGPATTVYIRIEDYIEVPSSENPDPPLNIIELAREEPPEEVFPIPAISLLLLSH